MDATITSALITVLGTLGGTFIGVWSQRQDKRLQSLQSRIDRYRQEIRARQAEEEIACTWLVEAGQAPTLRSALLSLRERTESECGVRPTMSPRDVAD